MWRRAESFWRGEVLLDQTTAGKDAGATAHKADAMLARHESVDDPKEQGHESSFDPGSAPNAVIKQRS
jgi:hypothetical protein